METTNTQAPAQAPMHPVAADIFKFVNEAITIEEAKARTALIESVVEDLNKGIADYEAAAKATDEAGNAVEVEEVEA